MNRRTWALTAMLLIGLAAASLVRQAVVGGGDKTWARITQTGVWRVGMDPSFPPFENLDASTGQPAGFDVDLARTIAGRWGVRVEFVGVGFDQLMDAVAANRVDSAISALPITPHRSEEMQFSRPYIEAGMVLVAPASAGFPPAAPAGAEPDGERALAAAAQLLDGKRVAAEWGSEGDGLARRLQTLLQGELQLVLRGSADEALAAVLAGEADAAIVDAVSAALFLGEGGNLVATGEPLRSDPYAIVTPKHAPELLRQVNEALDALEQDGTLSEIRARWLRPKGW